MKFLNKTAAVMCAISVLLSAISCGSAKESADTSGIKTDGTVQTDPATPASGIGRDAADETDSETKTERTPAEDNGYVICVDPGHGFEDGGCGEGVWEDGTLEKDINLSVAKKLKSHLELLGFTVILTHDGTAIPKSPLDDGNKKFNPNERVSYVNTLDIDYFVSIHVNSYDSDTSASGTRIYYEDDRNWRKTDKKSDVIADLIAEKINEETSPAVKAITYDQGAASYAVVRETLAAASLIEIGFCTNETDAANMVNEEWQDALACAIADGIAAFFTPDEGN